MQVRSKSRAALEDRLTFYHLLTPSHTFPKVRSKSRAVLARCGWLGDDERARLLDAVDSEAQAGAFCHLLPPSATFRHLRRCSPFAASVRADTRTPQVVYALASAPKLPCAWCAACYDDGAAEPTPSSTSLTEADKEARKLLADDTVQTSPEE